jgi:CO dehydrogenase maturation factor
VKVAVVGKGGAGKSVIAGTMARLIARRGTRVLALDSDPVPGLSISLGSGPEPAEPPLNEAVERDENGRWRLKKGVGPVRAVQRYATDAPDGVRMLQFCKASGQERAAMMPSVNAFYRIVQGLPDAPAFKDWAFVGDLPAGPRQAAYNWAPWARQYVVVVQPGVQSALTGRRVVALLRERGGADVLLIANRVRDRGDVRHVEKLMGEPVFASLPFDDRVARAERLGIAPIDYAADSPAIEAIERLVASLTAL